MPTRLPVISENSPLADGFSRKISYLRVSLTDRCNYRCTYCMPAEGIVFQPRADLLSFEEILRILGVFAGIGVRKIRLTGGEPTVRAGIVDLVGRITAIPGIETVVMTSNGHLFDRLAKPLADAGLSAVNISLDTLDPTKFRELTRRGELDRVIAGIDAARAVGIAVKTNAVALADQNGDEVVQICEFAWKRGIIPRFIEHMPMSDGALYSPGQRISAADIRAKIATAFETALVAVGPLDGKEPSSAPVTAGPARYWRLQNTPERKFGIISAMSEHFCETCNRLRLSATGALHPCLAFDDATSLRDVIRAGASDDELRRVIFETVNGKRIGHEFDQKGRGGPSKHMIAIGG